MARERFTDDGWPIGDQACFAQAARGQRLGDQPRGEFSQRLGAAPRALHHRFGAESEGTGNEVDRMSANVSAPASKAKRKAIVARTLAWWDRYRRTLPWRAEPGETPDPYRVWLSEVLLQQTTAQAATPYYQAFIAKWPKVEDLAAAPIEALMSAFAGLGYHSRARNLHACAKEITRRGGTFPARKPTCARFPASALIPRLRSRRSRLAARPRPVDGNIARILARLLAVEKPIARARGDLLRRLARWRQAAGRAISRRR